MNLSSTQLNQGRENHCSELIQQNNCIYLVVMGGWNGTKALTNCEIFKIIVEQTIKIYKAKEYKLELNIPRNRPVSICLK